MKLPLILALLASVVSAQTAPKITSPTSGSTLAGAAATITWTAATPGTGNTLAGYWLWVGSTSGTADLVNVGPLQGTTWTGNLPVNGAPVYVELWALIFTANNANYQWLTSSANYTEFTLTPAVITSPVSGAVGAPSTTFTWSGSSGAAGYYLWIGTTSGTANLVNIGPLTGTSATVSLPMNGASIFAQVWTKFNGGVLLSSPAMSLKETAAPIAAKITSPAAGSTLSGSSATFTWSAGSPATGYYLWVGLSPNTANLINIGPLPGTSATVNLPTNGAPLYVNLWTLTSTAGLLSPNSATYTEYTPVANAYKVNLNWQAPASSTDPVAGYILERAPSGGAYAQIGSQMTALAYTDTAVTNGQTYDYEVFSVDANGVKSAPSNVAVVPIP